MEYTYEAKVISWIDGDTVALEVFKHFDFGFHIKLTGYYEGHFRLLGVDTPERGKLNFKAATEAARKIAPVGSIVYIETFKTDKYGRYLAKVLTSEGVDISEALITMGLGERYPKVKTSGEVALAIVHESGTTEFSTE